MFNSPVLDAPVLTHRKQGRSVLAHQLSWTEASGWRVGNGRDPNLVLFFGARQALAGGERYRDLRNMFPHAHGRTDRQR
jgi:hypothetical protein